ncbi:BA75_04265T0 [Komagataella pastoris]|uniref:BA75_04265T0 n=1 Tax=Komagataella pastoris TaxID=4922 RepID=A0A1B2JFL0_PICPA|nr:BA75_04265T0 [Komagataella pastoris]
MSLRIAVVGTGIFATDTHLPALQKLDNIYQVVGCYNRTKAKAETFAKKAGITNVYDSLDELLADKDSIDVIDALLPVEYNPSIVESALSNGIPIAIEKPIAANLEDAHKVVELSRKYPDTPVFILEQWAYYKSIELIKKQLPRIGKLVSFQYSSTGAFNFNNKYLSTGWRQHPKHIGGYLSDGGVHQLALLTGVLGHIKSVSAKTTQIRELSGTVDTLYSLMETESGLIGTFTYGSCFGNTEKKGIFQILGDNGSIYLDFSPTLPSPKITVNTGGFSAESERKTEEIQVENENFDPVKEFQVFGEGLLKKDYSGFITTPEVAFHHLAIVDAALKSKGQSIDVEKP